ncbi:30S ribosomal protein S4 [Candidatus Pacearchaeota archaeon]|nr:30S ribosomal protein S4 [Candidatus Pacearchaeota archaeon]
MGDIKRKRKMFSRPRKLFDRTRMDEENVLVKRYGLKNKKEIWKAKTAVSKLRRRAKSLIGKDVEEQQVFFDKLNRNGMAVTSISDVLALTEESVFERRLQTMLFKKKLANTIKQARQLIVHKNVVVDGTIVNIPSFIVTKDLENKISIKEKKVAPEEKVAEESPIRDDSTDPEEATEEVVEETNAEENKK